MHYTVIENPYNKKFQNYFMQKEHQNHQICTTTQKQEKKEKPLSRRKLKKKNFWTESEDEILKQGVRKYGSTKWTKISKLLKSRPPKRCRQRWLNYLSTTYRKDLDENCLWLLYLAYKVYGNQWSRISKLLSLGDNIIKNKVNCLKRNNMYDFDQRLLKFRNDPDSIGTRPSLERKLILSLTEKKKSNSKEQKIGQKQNKIQQNINILSEHISPSCQIDKYIQNPSYWPVFQFQTQYYNYSPFMWTYYIPMIFR